MSVSNSVSIELSNRLTILDSVHWMFFFELRSKLLSKNQEGCKSPTKKDRYLRREV